MDKDHFHTSLVRLLITTMCTWSCILSGIYGQPPRILVPTQLVHTVPVRPIGPINPAFAMRNMGPVPPGHVINPYLPMPVPNVMAPVNPMYMPSAPRSGSMLATGQGAPSVQSGQAMVQPIVNPNLSVRVPGSRVDSVTSQAAPAGQMRMASSPGGSPSISFAQGPNLQSTYRLGGSVPGGIPVPLPTQPLQQPLQQPLRQQQQQPLTTAELDRQMAHLEQLQDLLEAQENHRQAEAAVRGLV